MYWPISGVVPTLNVMVKGLDIGDSPADRTTVPLWLTPWADCAKPTVALPARVAMGNKDELS